METVLIITATLTVVIPLIVVFYKILSGRIDLKIDKTFIETCNSKCKSIQAEIKSQEKAMITLQKEYDRRFSKGEVVFGELMKEIKGHGLLIVKVDSNVENLIKEMTEFKKEMKCDRKNQTPPT